MKEYLTPKYEQWETVGTCPNCLTGEVHYRYEIHPDSSDLADWGQCDWLLCSAVLDIPLQKAKG
ncbi:hypothetical protein [Neobacillus citreus]|uniref:Uncharacterized protein n=1 Tax=Neobacillus citreus TaxID=2833578 RepID=A0A942YFR8_9BACI|nr:hypothetical protein [Neobacillus citreus]MCH6265077.1 hypothetical protein [Neobacillus citreus]